MASSLFRDKKMEMEGAVAASRLDFSDLEGRLKELSPVQQRCARCLLGLAIGDCVGLPFELFVHRANRRRADEVAFQGSLEGLQHLVLVLMLERLGRFGPLNDYMRPYSDDTVITDAKVSAIVQFSLLRTAEESTSAEKLLWQCFLSQLLAWQGGNHGGKLFQGVGGFTKGLLRPTEWREEDKSTFRAFKVHGLGSDTWPTEVFSDWAWQYCIGNVDGEDGSWGNGTVMSFSPPVLANELCKEQKRREAPAGASAVAPSSDSGEGALFEGPLMNVFVGLHTHQHAKQAAALMQDIISAIVSGHVSSTAELPKFVSGLGRWKTLLALDDESYSMYPLRLFDEWMSRGDCSPDSATAFVVSLTGTTAQSSVQAPQGAYNLNPGNSHNGHTMGQLLRCLANWDDEQATPRLALPSGELVRFSQRGLNSLLIALWVVAGARCCWDWIARLIYIGGDADTVGAVAGQLAGPLLDPGDVHQTFSQFVGFTHVRERRRHCMEVTTAAARRYYSRILQFCRLEWDALATEPNLTEPYYEGLTPDLSAATASVPMSSLAATAAAAPSASSSSKPSRWFRGESKRANRSSSASRRCAVQTSDKIRVLWVDSAFQRIDRGRRYNEASKLRCLLVEQLNSGSGCSIKTETDWGAASGALRALAPFYNGSSTSIPLPRGLEAPFDVVVVEQDFQGNDAFGTTVYFSLKEEWKTSSAAAAAAAPAEGPNLGLERPQVILLTARWDKALAEFARREQFESPLKKPLVLVRFDDPPGIARAIFDAPCLPAVPSISASGGLGPSGSHSPSPSGPPRSQPMHLGGHPPAHRGDRATSMED